MGGAVLCGCLAGCNNRSDGTGSPVGSSSSDAVSSQDTNDVSTGTNSPITIGPSASVFLRTAYRFNYETDLIGVMEPDRDQFAFVTPPAEAPSPPPSEFTLERDDRQFPPVPIKGRVYPLMPGLPGGTGGIYFDGAPEGSPETRRAGALLFDVPKMDVDSAALLHNGTRYPLPEGSLPQFATAPDFHVESVAVSEMVRGQEVTLTVTVSNQGDRDGLFLAGGWIEAYPQTLNIGVPVGELRTGTISWDSFSGTGVTFVYAGGRREFSAEDRTEQPTEDQ